MQTTIAPQAGVMDHDPEALLLALQALGKHRLLALRVPQNLGGAGEDETTFRHFQELVARYSGALAFLQAQHQSAGSLLAHSQNATLKQAYLPKMATGEALVGISFAHLRRQASPIQAVEIPGGYQLNGSVPWVTGWNFFQTFIVAAVLPDKQAVYGMVPFQTMRQETGGELVCGEPMALAAMAATNTVTVEFQNWLLPSSQVVEITPVSTIARSDRLNVLQHSFFALGCAQAGLDILQTAYEQKQFPFIQTAHTALNQELETCRQKIFAAQPGIDRFEANLQLRAWAIDLAVRCAHAAIAASSGSANSAHHPAQRVYREALVYTVAGQTTEIMEATLGRLAHDRLAY